MTMPIKRVICPERIRQIPAHFSWVDHRLVRERYIERCDACAAAPVDGAGASGDGA
jgi:hypothetical protein